MKKMIVVIGVIVLAYTSVLMITFDSFENDLKLTAVGLSWENDSEEIMQRMEKVNKGTKSKILTIMAFPVGSYSINANGGVLPLWGALGQSILWALIVLMLIRPKLKKSAE